MTEKGRDTPIHSVHMMKCHNLAGFSSFKTHKRLLKLKIFLHWCGIVMTTESYPFIPYTRSSCVSLAFNEYEKTTAYLKQPSHSVFTTHVWGEHSQRHWTRTGYFFNIIQISCNKTRFLVLVYLSVSLSVVFTIKWCNFLNFTWLF